ncbi:mitochondrial carrier protein-like protein [Lineolata rhizophorae]|uniref:Mitochondrial carrier protein-like protein n=1 Tax=Lineolata rhizophorae TaxID=578093 RepID=A0A6A6PA89_9PEZI|nr:mitochondrial carrier protein-like protein [Lineolata rhizophorae]
MSANTNTDILLAGAIAAFSVDLLVYPIDTLKTRLQSPDYARRYVDAGTRAVNRPALFRGLYQGVGSVIIATLPSSGAFFTTYEGVKSALNAHNPRITPLIRRAGGDQQPVAPLLPEPVIHAAASSIAELVSCAILTPAEVIKQNAQMVSSTSSLPAAAQRSQNATLVTLRRFRAHPLALWRGYAALAGRNLPFTALQFPLFEQLRARIRRSREAAGKVTGSLLESGCITAVSAGMAGAVSAVVTTPIDVVKTRIMLAAGDEAGGRESANKAAGQTGGKGNGNGKGANGLVDALGKTAAKRQAKRQSSLAVFKQVWAQEGMKGLWRGGALRGVWTMVGSGLYLGVYDSGRVYLARRRGQTLDEDELF